MQILIWLLLLLLLFLIILACLYHKRIVAYFTVTTCATDADCAQGFSCLGPTNGPLYCIRRDCTTNTDCANFTGTSCVQTSAGMTCLPPACTTSDTCAPGKVCLGGYCVDPKPACTNSPCFGSGVCISNYCGACDPNALPSASTCPNGYQCVAVNPGDPVGYCYSAF